MSLGWTWSTCCLDFKGLNMLLIIKLCLDGLEGAEIFLCH